MKNKEKLAKKFKLKGWGRGVYEEGLFTGLKIAEKHYKDVFLRIAAIHNISINNDEHCELIDVLAQKKIGNGRLSSRVKNGREKALEELNKLIKS